MICDSKTPDPPKITRERAKVPFEQILQEAARSELNLPKFVLEPQKRVQVARQGGPDKIPDCTWYFIRSLQDIGSTGFQMVKV